MQRKNVGLGGLYVAVFFCLFSGCNVSQENRQGEKLSLANPEKRPQLQIIDGRYIAPPYMLKRIGTKNYVNDILLEDFGPEEKQLPQRNKLTVDPGYYPGNLREMYSYKELSKNTSLQEHERNKSLFLLDTKSNVIEGMADWWRHLPFVSRVVVEELDDIKVFFKNGDVEHFGYKISQTKPVDKEKTAEQTRINWEEKFSKYNWFIVYNCVRMTLRDDDLVDLLNSIKLAKKKSSLSEKIAILQQLFCIHDIGKEDVIAEIVEKLCKDDRLLAELEKFKEYVDRKR